MAGRNNNFGKADAKEVPNSTDNLPALNKPKKPKSEMFFFMVLSSEFIYSAEALLVLILSCNDAG